jgi:hypothetical protein
MCNEVVWMKSAAELREAARRYREIATEITDQRVIKALHELAAEYEALADKLDDAGTTGDGREGEPS